MKRSTIDEYFMEVAHAVAKRSTCLDKQVGCVLVDKNNHIIATGYNGNPRGFTNCSDSSFCDKNNGKVCVAVHAEQNAMLQCDVSKIHKCYSTLEPCMTCAALLLNTACEEIHYSKPTNKNKSGYKLWFVTKSSNTWIEETNMSTDNIVDNTTTQYLLSPMEYAASRFMKPIIEYHGKLGFPKRSPDITVKLQQHRDNCVALQAEVTELLDSAPWKPWRPNDYKNFDRENFKEEVVDCLFFLTALCENWDIAPHEIGQRLDEKLKENYKRIEDGYNVKTSNQ